MTRILFVLLVVVAGVLALDGSPEAQAASGYQYVTIHFGPAANERYVVFHSVGSGGICDPSQADHVPEVDFLVDAGPARIVDTSSGTGVINVTQEFAQGVATFSTATNSSVLEFPFAPQANPGQADECQAWVLTSNPTLGLSNIVVLSEAADGTDTLFDIIFYKKPTLSTEGPIVLVAGKPHVHLLLQGSDFGTAAQAFVNDQPLRTWGGDNRIHISIPGELIATPGRLMLTIVNANPDGGASLAIEALVQCERRTCEAP